MKKIILTIIGSAFLAMGLLSSTAAIPDNAKDDGLLIAQGKSEQMACWGLLHMCVSKNTVLPHPNKTIELGTKNECFDFCDSFNDTSKCDRDTCRERCTIGYGIFTGSCTGKPEVASLMDLFKKSTVVASQPETVEST